MADVYFLGSAATIPYVYSAVVTGTPTAAGTAVATVNSKTVTYTIQTGDTVAVVVAAIRALLVASAVPGEFKQFTYTIPTAGTLVATGPSDGAPVAFTLTVTGATVTATTTTNSSPYDLTNINNWSTGALPSGGDYAVFDADVPVKYNLSGLATVAIKFRRTPNHKSDIGLPDVNPLGFAEYRATKLSVLGLVWEVFDSGSGTVRLTAPAIPTGLTFNAAGGNKILTNISSTTGLVAGMGVSGTGIAADSTIASVDSSTQITLTSSTNVTVGTGVAATFSQPVVAAIRGADANVSGRTPTVEFYGTGATWNTTVNGGTLSIVQGTLLATLIAARASIRVPNLLANTTCVFNNTYAQVALTVATSGTLNAGSLVTFLPTSSSAAISVTGSTLYWGSSGTVASVDCGLSGVFNALQAPSNFTVTSGFTLASGATIDDPYARINRSVTIVLTECAPGDVRLNLGSNPTFAVS